jgi:hypothetical protein
MKKIFTLLFLAFSATLFAQKTIQVRVSSLNDDLEFDTSSLMGGMYLVKVSSDRKASTRKLVIQH